MAQKKKKETSQDARSVFSSQSTHPSPPEICPWAPHCLNHLLGGYQLPAVNPRPLSPHRGQSAFLKSPSACFPQPWSPALIFLTAPPSSPRDQGPALTLPCFLAFPLAISFFFFFFLACVFYKFCGYLFVDDTLQLSLQSSHFNGLLTGFVYSSFKDLTLNVFKTKLVEFSGDTMDKHPPTNAGDVGSIPGPGRVHVPWSN